MGRRLDWQSKQRYLGINEIRVEECLNWTRLDSIADSQFKTGDWHLCVYVPWEGPLRPGKDPNRKHLGPGRPDW